MGGDSSENAGCLLIGESRSCAVEAGVFPEARNLKMEEWYSNGHLGK